MANWKISKDFYIDYGHRVWTQELDPKYCAVGDASCKCKHFHGHTGKVTVEVEADELQGGFVTDFKHLGFMKDWLDEYFDHRFIIDIHDPYFVELFKSFEISHWLDIDKNHIGRFEETGQSEIKEAEREYIESFSVVPFVPTSENLAQFIFEFAQKKLGSLATVSSVTWQETPKSKAIYTL